MFFLGGGWGIPPLLGLVPCLVATTLAAKGIKGRFWPGESPREEELPLSNASSTTFNEMADPGAEVCSTILSAKGTVANGLGITSSTPQCNAGPCSCSFFSFLERGAGAGDSIENR